VLWGLPNSRRSKSNCSFAVSNVVPPYPTFRKLVESESDVPLPGACAPFAPFAADFALRLDRSFCSRLGVPVALFASGLPRSALARNGAVGLDVDDANFGEVACAVSDK
jgi:hypothetical protein